jgi:membrane fusion protein (multidrug efflux system)
MSTPERSSPDSSATRAPDAAIGSPSANGTPSPAPESAPEPAAPRRPVFRHAKRWIIGSVIALVVLLVGIPWLIRTLNTVETDDAYVNGHVTFVAPRVAGQIARVLVDDNNRVRKGDLLVQLDKEPFQVQLNIAQAAVDAAHADLVAAQADVRAAAGKARAARFGLQHAMEDVDNLVALLRSKVATLDSQQATLAKAKADYDRALPLQQSGAVTQEDVAHRRQAMLVAQAQVEEALQNVYQVRVSLGLPPKPDKGEDLTEVPPDLDQTFSSVRQAQYAMIQAAAALGVSQPFNATPKEMIAEFYKRDPSGDVDKIYEQLFKTAPPVKQAESKLMQAQRNLDQAELNLKYCDVVAEIDGVVTRRSVNPGNNVIAGQSLMAVRSLAEIWIEANFKETQVGDLRIGQSVDLDVDMYGRRRRFKGRISGFTFGTGSTLALLPAENATGNFVKVVQRLPVRVDLVDYDPDKTPLFVGLSVTASVDLRKPASGPDAGNVLQPHLPSAAAPPPTLPSQPAAEAHQ